MLEKIKEQLEAAFVKLKFTEKTHRYSLKGKTLTATSIKLKNFYKPFDKNIAFHVAGKGKYKNMSAIEILNSWEDKKNKSADFGTRTHKFGEEYAIRPIYPTNNSELGIVQWWMDKPDYLHLVATEVTMYSEKFKYGGTADIILYNELDDSLIIADYKTNEDLHKNYNNQKMLEPFQHLLDTTFNHYQLQLSHYQICLEEKGFKVSRRILIHLTNEECSSKFYKNYDTEDFTKQIKEYYGNNTTTY